MASGILITKEFAYPTAAALSTFYLLTWQTLRVGMARKAAGIAYPQVYAEKAEAVAKKEALQFNCAQRAHHNTLEDIPIIIGTTLIAGLAHPIASAALCGVWVVTRVLYTVGYATGDPAKRNSLGAAMFGTFCKLGLIGTATAGVVGLIRSL